MCVVGQLCWGAGGLLVPLIPTVRVAAITAINAVDKLAAFFSKTSSK